MNEYKSRSADDFKGVVKHAGRAPGYFTAITVIAVAEQHPDEVFKRFCHPLGHPEVFSSVKAVEELSRVEQAGLDGKQLCELEVKQHVEMSVFGKTIRAPMRLKLVADHDAQQLRFSMMEGNNLMRKVEGVYAVVPCQGSYSQQELLQLARTVSHSPASAGRRTPSPALMASISSSSPQSSSNSSSHSSSKAQAPDPDAGSLGKAISASSRLWRGGQGRDELRESDTDRATPPAQGPRSIIIMHQKVKPFMAPPPPFNRLLKGHLVRQFETMMYELLAACQHTMLTSAANTTLPSVPRV